MILYRFRLRCVTENEYKFVWEESTNPVPALCPTNTSHTIDTNLTTVVETIDNTLQLVKKVDTDKLEPTSAVTLEEGFVIDVNSGVTEAEHAFSFPFSIEPLGAEMLADYPSVNRLDYYQVVIILATDPAIGIVTANGVIGDTIINVSGTVINNVKLNYLVKFGADINEYRVKAIGNNTITLFTGLVNTINVGDIVKIRIPITFNRYIYPNEINKIGDWSEGAKNIPANFIVRSKIFFNSATSQAFKIPYTVFYKY